MKRELKTEVLLALKIREEYGYSISKILASKGNKIHLGYLYETLGEMESEKLIKSRWEEGVGGPKRRVYSLTNKGRIALDAMLKESIQALHHFYNAYLASLPPESNVVWTIFQAINDILPVEKAQHIVIIITFPLNPAIETAIRLVQMKAKNAKLYLIKPSEVEVSLDLPNLTTLDGTPEDVPLKSSFADLIYLESIFSAADTSGCVRELRRIIKLGGVVAFGAPHLHMAEAKDPLDIGEYIEKVEYELSRGTGIVHRTTIQEEISKHFAAAEVLKAGPISVFISTA